VSEPARAILLHTFAAMAGSALTAWPEILAREAAAHAMPGAWRGLLLDPPPAAAVRVAHALEMGGAGLQAWNATWSEPQLEAAPLRLAAAVAEMLAGREELLLLAGAAGGANTEEYGALVDGESCARMAVSGLDAETEIRLGNCTQLLASSGDLVNVRRPVQPGTGPTRYLVLGLRRHAPARD
jgi:hypothetical protein